jgi:uroporphyrinogen decarboxylase
MSLVMTKRERVAAALAGRPVDRPPVAFWRHAPDVDHTAAGLASAMLAFHARYDLDVIKVMSSGVYCVEDWGCRVADLGTAVGSKQCVEHAVKTRADWPRIRPLDPGAGALGRELEAVRRIVAGRPDDAPVLHTLFTPLTIAHKLAGDRLFEDLRRAPDTVRPALEAITETMVRYAGAALEAGADGIFFATQTATAEHLTEEEVARWEVPFDRRVLTAVQAHPAFTWLHLHGRALFFDRLAGLPVHAVNWSDRLTAPTLAEARRRVPRAVVGGLNEAATLRTGPPAAIEAEVEDAMVQTAGLGLIVTPGCALRLDIPAEHLTAVVRAVRRDRAHAGPR